ncbi:MAG: hypothetical protein JOY84_18065 [Curvibacter sp.]|nr:hypothetical protein [Curvibacter sp.]
MSLAEAPEMAPDRRKHEILQRIERQRLLRRARRLQAAIDRLQAEGTEASGGAGGAQAGAFPRSRLFSELLRSPWLMAGLLGLAMATGPGRFGRLASWLLPLLWRRAP